MTYIHLFMAFVERTIMILYQTELIKSVAYPGLAVSCLGQMHNSSTFSQYFLNLIKKTQIMSGIKRL